MKFINKKSWSFLILILTFWYQNSLSAQNVVFEAMQKNTEAQKKLSAYGIKADVNEWFATMGYTDTTIHTLKKFNIDIKSALANFYSRTEAEKTVLSDCIVIGKVIDLEYDSSDTPYHTIASINVETFLRNDYRLKKNLIKVLLQAGPTKNGNWVYVTHEDPLVLNGHVLLFLSASGLLVDSKWNQSSLLPKLQGSKEIFFKIVGGDQGRYSVMDNEVELNGKRYELKSVGGD